MTMMPVKINGDDFNFPLASIMSYRRQLLKNSHQDLRLILNAYMLEIQ